MVKVGSYYYPSRKVAPMVESIRLIGEKLKSNSASLEVIASILGYKSTQNGAFRHTLADLRKYGLIDGRGNEIKLSELAHKILAPNMGEEKEAYREMIFRMPLWKEIYDKFGKNPSDFSVAIQKIAGINRLEADAVKNEIGKLYIDAVSKISNEIGSTEGDNMNQQMAPQQQEPSAKFDLNKDVLTFSAEGISLKITNDPEHLEKAGAFINLFLAQKPKKKGKKEDDVLDV
jgi:hypothetical protein